MRFVEKAAVFTGAGTGIGIAVTNRLRAEGPKVLAVDRYFPEPQELDTLAIDVAAVESPHLIVEVV